MNDFACMYSLVFSLLFLGCGGDDPQPSPPDVPDAAMRDAAPDAAPPPDYPGQVAPQVIRPVSGVVRETFLVPGATPPPNPITGEATPERYNFTQVVRYRSDTPDPTPVRAVMIAMPGFLGGGASYEGLARSLVLRGAASGEGIEVWAIDRRANLLEDHRGLDTAEVAEDAEIAAQFYFGNATIDGEGFTGFHSADDLSFQSEWGMTTHIEDLRAVIALIPEAARRGRVFLAGHSFGASIAELYAAWRFADGGRGVEELAGLIFIDGVLGDSAIGEEEYQEGGGTGFFRTVGIEDIRSENPYFAFPILGMQIYVTSEIGAMRNIFTPSEVRRDSERDRALQLLLTLRRLPAMTDRAAFAFAFDDCCALLAISAIQGGEPTGGPLEAYTDPIFGGMLMHPSDPEATYDWRDADELDPPEFTDLDTFARSWYAGATGFAEWYWPNRLRLDAEALGGAAAAEDSWQAREGMRAFDGAQIDAPILAVAAGLVPPRAYAELPGRVASAIGEGRPQAGATRDSEDAYRVLDATSLTHIDPVSGVDQPTNPVPAAIESFLMRHAIEGGLVLEAP